MYETLLKTHEPTTYALPTVGDAIARITAVEHKKAQRRAVQIDDARRKKEAKEARENKRKREEEGANEEGGVGGEGEKAAKVAKVEGEGTGQADEGGVVVAKAVAEAKADAGGPRSESSPAPAANGSTGANARLPKEQRLTTFRQGDLSRGHTSYLTFAVLLPVEQAPAEGVEELGVEGKEEPVEGLAGEGVVGAVEGVVEGVLVEERGAVPEAGQAGEGEARMEE